MSNDEECRRLKDDEDTRKARAKMARASVTKGFTTLPTAEDKRQAEAAWLRAKANNHNKHAQKLRDEADEIEESLRNHR
jgi:hypothetical protein